MQFLKIAIAMAMLLGTGAARASVITIDFGGYSNGQSIGSTYAPDGLTFSDAYFWQCGGAGCPPAATGLAYGGPSSVEGPFQIDFATPQSDIKFQTPSYSSTLATAYNASNQVIATVADNEGFPITDQWDQLVGNNITRVVFSYDGYGYNGPAITNLTFNVNPVPEPSSLVLMLAGLGLTSGAFYFGRRKFIAGRVVTT